ncbi:Short-chain dehydrogenase/reductase [Naegleria gruberi]|uniref:Short-chain dehydrogenase/reductase n=1 Tax=Naegleria gruberi TaxID=5762 RepID=D2VIX5_NAEGR|nr:Short-chain dehydrogenase/reductase [Naegleria gruberi]EFC43178.1 Short-chain dehydrogenase/reductase [Naegleria gruberi]|eukprot:XP_002675922.1 Short-chain dehydrogenase/reductase [Naegleria gruberi strain NEG-M]
MSCCGFSCVVYTLGVILGLVLLKKVVGFIYAHFIYKNSTNYRGKNVLITGATSGIGEGFAHEFSRRGANVIVVARNEEKGQNLKNTLETKYKNQVSIAIVDFEKASREEIKQALLNVVGNNKVDVLVNNVGINNTNNSPFPFTEQPESDFDKLIKVNLHSVLSVTRAIMPIMNERGTILNLSSYTAQYPTPLMTVYAATKSFINAFSLALKYEAPKMEVYGLSPMWVKSDMTMVRRATLMKPEATVYARSCVDIIGCPFGVSYGLTSAYWPHDLVVSLLALVPESFLMKQMKGFLSGLMKKMQKKAEEKKQ